MCSLGTSLSDGIAATGNAAPFGPATMESTPVTCGTAIPAYEGTGTAVVGTRAIWLIENGGAGANVYGYELEGRETRAGVDGKVKNGTLPVCTRHG